MTHGLLLGLAAFVVMEPATYAAHRWVMHGMGWSLHRSHHRVRPRAERLRDRIEANDWFPVMFASVTILAMALGSYGPSWSALVPVGVGVTAYGAAYAFVHDVYIHGRVVPMPVVPVLERLARAHALHHRYGAEPYGMLLPVVPRALRERAETQRAETQRARAARPTTPTLRARGTRARWENTS